MVRGGQSGAGAGPRLRPSGLRPLDAGGRGGQGLTGGVLVGVDALGGSLRVWIVLRWVVGVKEG